MTKIIHKKETLITCLDQIFAWENNLNQPQPERHRKDCDDRTTVHSVRYWYQGYINGLRLHGWIQ